MKLSVVSLLQSATLPNWHWKLGPWEESIDAKKFSSKTPQDVWPHPRQEDDQETDAMGSEVEGESC